MSDHMSEEQAQRRRALELEMARSRDTAGRWYLEVHSAGWNEIHTRMTPRQRRLIREFNSQAQRSWSQLSRELSRGRVSEAERCHAAYRAHVGEVWAIFQDLMTCFRAGLPLERVGEGVVPPGVEETRFFREESGLIEASFKRHGATE
jgi:hypothetical protein